MSEVHIPRDSLVLYKNKPARVREAGEKLEIELDRDTRLRVRVKDVELLHPGPLQSLEALVPQEGEVKIAWELLQGSKTSLPELAELVYGDFTPATAWAAWQLVEDGLYFQGVPRELTASSSQEVEQEKAARRAKAEEEQAWNAFLERIRFGQYSPDDDRYLREIEDLALGLRSNSRVLQALGSSESPENAHAKLLELGYWDETVDPYPRRKEVNVSAPSIELPDLPGEQRKDLTHLPAYAIDDEGSQDPDDAVSIDGERLWVHIADAAALVPPDSMADLEARSRGTSVYLPEGTAPMLPPKAVEVLGLGLQEISPALSFGLQLDASGELKDIEIVPSWVRVERLSYEQAESKLSEAPFNAIYRLVQTYQDRRQWNQALFIDLPEIKVKVDRGEVKLIPILPLRSRDMVREAMLMAGEAAARFAIEHDIPVPFTTQEGDGSERGTLPEGMAGAFAMRRGLKRSQVSSSPAPHAGLGLPVYTRTTSPLRRYLDLVVHQQLRAYLKGEMLLDTQELLERVGASEAVTNVANQVERQAERHWTLVYLLRHPDWKGEGILVEKHGSRGKVLIPELGLEPQVHLRQDLPLNSTVQLALRGVDLPELEAFFRVQQRK